MHFSPPSKDSINTDFTNLNAISESGRNSVSRQSLIGEFTLVASFYMSGVKKKLFKLMCFFRLKRSVYHLSQPFVLSINLCVSGSSTLFHLVCDDFAVFHVNFLCLRVVCLWVTKFCYLVNGRRMNGQNRWN